MEQDNIRVYSYRWVILGVFMLVVAINQVMWITFAPITGPAAAFYKVSDLIIGLLSMIFMVVYIFVSIPASWLIDTYGFRVAVGTGAVLTGIFGLMRGIYASDLTMVFIAQTGLAIAQPFIMNALTMIVARWFPLRERATAAGLGTMSIYLGNLVAMVLTPYLMIHSGMGNMLMIYGVVSVVIMVLFLILAREHPPTPACLPGQEKRSLVFDGMKDILRMKQFIILLLIFFVGLGVFNCVATWIEDIVRPRNFSISQAGVMGGLMIFGGLIGAVIMSWLSDRYHKRIPFIWIALGGSSLGMLGITFATSYGLLLLSGFAMGFFLLSSGPIGFQYGAEIANPAPEGTSNGLLLMVGQISGILFIFGMDLMKSPQNGSMTLPLLILFGMMMIGLILSFSLKESKLLSSKSEKPGKAN
ncbi:MAG: MFS transporter [Bacteroidota bacterium]|nr:MFS transporter [Bacteroidota bacterium]